MTAGLLWGVGGDAVAQAPEVGEWKSLTTRRVFLPPHESGRYVDDVPISMSDDGESVGWATSSTFEQRAPSETHRAVQGYWVVDQGSSAVTPHTLRVLDTPIEPLRHSNQSQLSGDGLSFVATYSSVDDFAEGSDCATNESNYRQEQILIWARSSRSSPFGDPELVTRAAGSGSECTGQAWSTQGQDPFNLMGRGGEGDSWGPSVTSDGGQVAFVSRASDLGSSPTDADRAALYVWDGSAGSIEMVTPAGINADIDGARISGDGTRIVFTSTASNIVGGGAVPSGNEHSQVYVATADGSGWTFSLVSRSPSGAAGTADSETVASYGLAIDNSGDRVAFWTEAEDLQSGVSAPHGDTSTALAVRDLSVGSSGQTRYVVRREDDGQAPYLGEGGGEVAMSPDGKRVVSWAYDFSGGPGATRLQAVDADVLFSGSPENAYVGRRKYRPGANLSGSVALAGNETDGYVAMFPSVNAPRDMDLGGGPSLYVVAGNGIGHDGSTGWHGDPVDTGTGAFRQDETDIPAPAGAGPASLRRSYSSFGESTGRFGQGWMSDLDTHLDVEEDSAVMHLPNGQMLGFVRASSGWVSVDDRRLHLGEDDSGLGLGAWKVIDSSGVTRYFDGAGHMTAVAEPDQPLVQITWVWSSGAGMIPTSISSASGYEVALHDWSYELVGGIWVANEAIADGLVDQAEANDGRVVDYSYDPLNDPEAARLKSVSRPHRADQDPGTYGVRHYMMAGSLLERITDDVGDERHHVVVENVYDDWGRVHQQTTETGDVSEFTYGQRPNGMGGWIDAPGVTTVTDTASGDMTVYEHNAAGELLAVTDALGKSVSREWDDGFPAAAASRSDIDTDYGYDTAGRLEQVSQTFGTDTRVLETLTYWVSETSPAALTDNRVATRTDAAGVTTTYTYEGSSRQPKTVSVPCDSDSDGAQPENECPTNGLATTTYEYFDGIREGLVESQTDPDDVVTEFTYHDDRSLESQTVYDGATARTTTFETIRVTDTEWDPSWPDTAIEARRTTSPHTETEVAETLEFLDAEGRVIESRDPLYDGTTHHATLTDYTLDGEIESVTDPAGNTTTYLTLRSGDAGWGYLVQTAETALDVSEVRVVTDPMGVSAITFTDRSGDVVLEKKGTLVADWQDPDPTEEEQLALATTTKVYEELGRLKSTTGPDGVTTWYDYDDEGRTIGVTTGPVDGDPDHTVVTDYDDWGNVESVTTPYGDDPDEDAVSSTTRYYTDDAGRTYAQIDGYGGPTADQLMTGFVYDDAGRQWRTIVHLDGDLDPADALVAELGDRVTETRYTPGGRTAQSLTAPDDVTELDWDEADDVDKSVTTFGYDDAGRQDVVTGPDGLDTTTTYDPAGRTKTVTTPGGHVTTYEYDLAGQVESTITPSGLTGSTDPEWVQVDRTYTPTGQVETETDPYAPGVDLDPATRSFHYDLAGRLDEVTDANGDVVTYGYDERGNRDERLSVDELDNPITEAWDYDLAGRVEEHWRPHLSGDTSAPSTEYIYDPDFGWLWTVTDPTGRVDTREYYSDGTLRSQTNTGPSLDTLTVERWIDTRGRYTARRDTTGTATPTTTTWSYTRDGKQASVTHPGSRTVSYGWNLDGTLAKLTHADGAQRRYGYDTMGRVTTVAVAATPTGTGVPFATLTYDDDGHQKIETVHAAGGSARHRNYDDAGRLTNYLQYWDDDNSGWDITGEVIEYRTDGRIKSRTRTPGGTESYDYDDAGQLTTVTGGPSPMDIDYGPRGNRTSADQGSDELIYTYNPNGSTDTITGDDMVAEFTYDDAGRRTGVVTEDGDGAPLGTLTQTHDAAGRARTVTRTFGGTTTTTTRTWDGDNNLATLNFNDGVTFPWSAQYLWDTANGEPRLVDSYLYGALHGRHDVTNQYLSVEINLGSSTLLQWYGYDALGNAVDPNDNPLLLDNPDTYDPWGTPTPGVDEYEQGIYRGSHRWGDLVHLWARDYHPETGQFTAPDPLDGVDGTPTVANPYHYADNDPLNKTDPTGMRPEDETYCLPADQTSPPSSSDYLSGNTLASTACQGPGSGPLCFTWQQGCESLISQWTGGSVCAAWYDEGCIAIKTSHPGLYRGLLVVAGGALVVATCLAFCPAIAVSISVGGSAPVLAGVGGSVVGTGTTIAIAISTEVLAGSAGLLAGYGIYMASSSSSGGGSNHAHQQKQFEDAWRECQRQVGPLTRAQRRILHDAITGQGFDYHGILAECIELFG
jgi:RHS repeat-associated protein